MGPMCGSTSYPCITMRNFGAKTYTNTNQKGSMRRYMEGAITRWDSCHSDLEGECVLAGT
ncbi:hypothetical protein ACS0TY_030768 [Phlomoides rotata]